jgi:hypothetical protein
VVVVPVVVVRNPFQAVVLQIQLLPQPRQSRLTRRRLDRERQRRAPQLP